jgi:uncharacterized protein (DUF1330 family)
MKTIVTITTAFISSLFMAKAQTDNPSSHRDDSTVYFMISYDIVNVEEFSKYGPKIRPLLKKYGAEVLASDTEAIVFEGSARRMNAIIKFPSKEAAGKCYNDPSYADIKKIRINSTKNCTMVLVKHFNHD